MREIIALIIATLGSIAVAMAFEKATQNPALAFVVWLAIYLVTVPLWVIALKITEEKKVKF